MKRMKKLMALVIAVAMVLAMGITSFAADTHSISVAEGDTHTYRVFQVLTGTLAEEKSAALGNPAWGADAKDSTKNVNEFIASLEGKSEAEVAKLVAAAANTTGDGRGTVDAANPITGLATGYYVLVDVTDPLNPLETKSLNVVKVVNDIEGWQVKYDSTSDDKIITTDTLGDDSTENEINGKTDNVSIGDTVNFQITAKVPAKAVDYNYFYFVINDTLDPGLTLDPDSIVVYKDSVSTANKLAATDYAVKTGTAADPKTFQVGLNDAKSLAGKDIIVTYSAVLNENATIGEVPNKNTSTVTFSNDPNHDYNGDPENPKPGFPDSEDLKVTGETPASVTETYTTGIELQKVDEDGNVLTGAEFTITGKSTEIVLVSSETFTEAEEGTTGEYYGLNNGTYTKEAPVEADYMKKAEAGATKGYVVAEDGYEGDDAITVAGIVYRPVKEGDTGTVYVLVKANADKYDGKTYNKTVTYTQKDTTGEGAVDAKAEVGPDGVVRFVGLGAGQYTITETKTPSGYNTLAPVTITIGFTANPATGEVHWSKTAGNGDFTYNKDTGVFEAVIVNQKGTELPTTGGIGTTIFYIVGAILVIGGGILLVSRRRMSSN